MNPESDMKSLPMLLAAAVSKLPVHLTERIRVVSRTRQRQSLALYESRSLPDGPIVYWTHHAQRTVENPALDTAIELSIVLERPLLVYQGLSERYRYASDRHHWFQLQSARDLSQQYRSMGVRYALHVETAEDATPSLLRLARCASVLVTEDFPGEPTDRWLERLAYLPGLTCLAVDTACVVPMRLVGRAFDRAFAFRDATKKLYAERIDKHWPVASGSPKAFEGKLPFEPVEIESVDLQDLIACCRIDHGVGPVADTPGGSVEGYKRWNAFVAGPLKQYAAKRNDPISGVASRMSAYLHYGMVSPMRLAREANGMKAEKYLDELLIWRELAYGFCFYRPEYASTKALPNWAVATLAEHEADDRPAIYSWETLSRARTEDRLWNACQESLLRHGELHNNVRMTWGKALLRWTRNANEALELLIDLNHRYALDGRDPASYGGILWCLGQFDRPFSPEQTILGTVRDRPTSEHSQRMRLEPYEAHVRRSISRRESRVAVIGAGMAGSMCARTLADHGVDVTLIEKSRGFGGRCASRRLWESVIVDHGAPYAEFADPRWDWFVRSWHQDGVIAPWRGDLGEWNGRDFRSLPSLRPRWVGLGGMNAIGKHLGRELKCLLNHRLVAIEEGLASYRLQVETQDAASTSAMKTLEPFDAIVFAIPTEQVRSLVPAVCDWRELLPMQAHEACWTLMMVLESRWNVPFDGVRCSSHGLSWLGRESSKPGRSSDIDAWVVQMDAEWTSRHLECDPQEVAERILIQIRESGLPELPGLLHRESHRWRYAKPVAGLSDTEVQENRPTCFWDRSQGVGACGDGWVGTGIEGALESGRAMAGRIITWLTSLGPSEASLVKPVKPGGYIQRELF